MLAAKWVSRSLESILKPEVEQRGRLARGTERGEGRCRGNVFTV